MSFAEVAVDAPVAPLRTFSYSVPSALDVRVGSVVRVPFGQQRLQGVIFSLPAAPAVPETRDILSVSGSIPPLTGIQLRLARWVSSYYLCSLFEAAAPMLPPGGRLRRRTYYSIGEAARGQLDDLTAFQRRVLEYLEGRDLVSEEQASRALGDRAGQTLARLADRRLVVRSHRWAGARVSPKTLTFVRLADAAVSSPDRLPPLPDRAPRQTALLERLRARGTPMPQPEARKEYGYAVNALLEKGWIERETVPVDRDPLAGDVFPAARPVVLTETQRKAALAVGRALDDRAVSPRTFLLEGVTGSGKTEVYLDAVQRCLALGRRAIVLVPEIALTRQTIERFASRFPSQVAVLHSGLSAGERFDQWWKVRQGQYGLVIGSRSAIFAPQPDLGLVVVDEEHEWTYKDHNASPRYHARDVAFALAGLTDAVVLLGSATPDVVSYHRARRGGVGLLHLPRRVASSDDGGAPAGTAPPEHPDRRHAPRAQGRKQRNLQPPAEVRAQRLPPGGTPGHTVPEPPRHGLLRAVPRLRPNGRLPAMRPCHDLPRGQVTPGLPPMRLPPRRSRGLPPVRRSPPQLPRHRHPGGRRRARRSLSGGRRPALGP